MKLNKKQWTIIGIVIGLIAIWYFFLRKKKNNESSFDRTKEVVKTNRAFVNTKTNRAFVDMSNPISTPQANRSKGAMTNSNVGGRIISINEKDKIKQELDAMKAKDPTKFANRIQLYENLLKGDTQRLTGGNNDCGNECILFCSGNCTCSTSGSSKICNLAYRSKDEYNKESNYLEFGKLRLAGGSAIVNKGFSV